MRIFATSASTSTSGCTGVRPCASHQRPDIPSYPVITGISIKSEDKGVEFLRHGRKNTVYIPSLPFSLTTQRFVSPLMSNRDPQ